jgi:pseudaminic acid cytidylyltransferase
MRIAVVPARAGSKRIPRKSIREFLGTPIIAYAIGAALRSQLFDRVVVSTDDDEIAEMAERWGATAPFRRPAELSDDHASTDAVLMHAINECERIYGAWEQGCCIYPANPFLAVSDLQRGLDLLTVHGATSAFPVVKYDFPIEQAFVLDGVRPQPRWPDLLLARSQDLPDHYHDAGMFYWFDVRKFLDTGALFSADAVAFAVPADRCQDINTFEDWARAEMKYRLMAQS